MPASKPSNFYSGAKGDPLGLPQNGPFHIKLCLARAKSVAAFKTTPNPLLPGSSRLSKWFFPASLVPPWCLADCPIDPFLPPWCLPSCLNGSFLPPWCLAGCPNGSFLPPWCLPGASQTVQLILSCLPGASQAVQMVLSCLPGASLVPRKLSN